MLNILIEAGVGEGNNEEKLGAWGALQAISSRSPYWDLLWASLLISWLQPPSAVILEPPEIKSDTVSTVSPSICHEVMGPDAMILVFWMLSFKPTFSLSSFTFIKRLFSSSSLSAIRVVSSAYLWRKLSTEKLMLLNCGVREGSWESLGLQGDPTSPSWRRSVLGVHWKD